MNVGSRRLAQGRDLVDEAHLGREKGVARVLGELGALDPGGEDRRLDEVEGTVELAQERLRARVLHPQHDPIGAHEVLDRGALAEELRIGRHVEVGIGAGFCDQPPHLAGGADGDRGLRHHDRVAPELRSDRLRRLVHVAQIRVAVPAPGRSAHRDEHELRRSHLRTWPLFEPQPSLRGVAPDDILEPRLVDGDLPAPQSLYPVPVDVHARHVRPELGEARAGNEPDVARADHDHPHRTSSVAPAAGAPGGIQASVTHPCDASCTVLMYLYNVPCETL